jgi:CRP-like cAMP-binding protein
MSEFAEFDIWKTMDGATREAIQTHFEKRPFKVGDALCQEGERGDCMFIVLSGTIEVLRKGRKEGETKSVSVLGPGQAVGEACVIEQHPRNATIKGKEPGEILVCSAGAMAVLKKQNPAAALSLYEGILRQVSARFRALADKKDMLSFWLS